MFKLLHSIRIKALMVVSFVFIAGFVATETFADHDWLNYHWARTSNPFTITLHDNLTTSWDPYLTLAGADWTLSSVLDTNILPGTANPKTCKPVAGKVEICNSKYGKNGWLGIASVWASGSHIVQGTVKMNDTYFTTSTYNKPEWKEFVMCQEIGHTFGLDHQDENFSNSNLDTCMDYTNNPLSNQIPNQHDYDMLETIYEHLDTTTTIASNTALFTGNEINHDDESSWGKSIRTSKDGKASLYVKETKAGKVFTFVVWAE